MSYDLEDRVHDRPLPTDITQRVPVIYRREGVIASLVTSVITVVANWRLNRAARRYRRGIAPAVPEHLRKDLGLPPIPKFPEVWETRW